MWSCSIPRKDRKGTVTWTILRKGDDLVWRLANEGDGTVDHLSFTLPFNPLVGAAAFMPGALNAHGYGEGPWLLAVPDFGHLRVDANLPTGWGVINKGRRARGGGKLTQQLLYTKPLAASSQAGRSLLSVCACRAHVVRFRVTVHGH